jgi:hypothetical protein
VNEEKNGSEFPFCLFIYFFQYGAINKDKEKYRKEKCDKNKSICLSDKIESKERKFLSLFGLFSSFFP